MIRIGCSADRLKYLRIVNNTADPRWQRFLIEILRIRRGISADLVYPLRILICHHRIPYTAKKKPQTSHPTAERRRRRLERNQSIIAMVCKSRPVEELHSDVLFDGYGTHEPDYIISPSHGWGVEHSSSQDTKVDKLIGVVSHLATTLEHFTKKIDKWENERQFGVNDFGNVDGHDETFFWWFWERVT
ncbi:hypothetical protein Lser_V15G26171 [Lactuca serriola]